MPFTDSKPERNSDNNSDTYARNSDTYCDSYCDSYCDRYARNSDTYSDTFANPGSYSNSDCDSGGGASTSRQLLDSYASSDWR